MPRPIALHLAALTLLASALLACSAGAFAHRDWCHGLHACPSDHDTYVCGDKGRCDLCPDNKYCEGGVSRQVSVSPPVPLLRQKSSGKSGDRGGGGGSRAGSGGDGSGGGSQSTKPRKTCPPVSSGKGASKTAGAKCPKPKRTKSTPPRKSGGSKKDATTPSGEGDDRKK